LLLIHRSTHRRSFSSRAQPSCPCFSLLLIFLPSSFSSFLFFFNHTAPPEIYTLSLHDALPISADSQRRRPAGPPCSHGSHVRSRDRKSTRLNSSHVSISYAVFCLKKKIRVHDLATCQISTKTRVTELRRRTASTLLT